MRQQAEAGIKAFEQHRGVTLTQGQKEATRHILTSPDRVIGIQGDAGTGKTTMLASVKEQAEQAGDKVRGLGFTGKAASEIEQAAGIKSQTIDSFLYATNRDSKISYAYERGNIVIEKPPTLLETGIRYDYSKLSITNHPDAIKQGRELWVEDEASMLGSRKMHELLSVAQQAEARVVLIGDTKQL